MNQSYDINILWEEAKTRWLRPAEVYFILQNHESLPITSEPPHQPLSGSLFLYNRRVLRYFRRDGHAWQRKKDGRNVGEAHERLKVGNYDALSCYYARGENNPSFQRRCFWMLDPAYEHIVLVHYRDLSEGRDSSATPLSLPSESTVIPDILPAPDIQYDYGASYSGYQNSSHSQSGEVTSHFAPTEIDVADRSEANRASSWNETGLLGISNVQQVDKSGLAPAIKKLAEQLSLEDDDYIFTEQTLPEHVAEDSKENHNLQSSDISGESRESPSWKDMLETSSGSPRSFNLRISELSSGAHTDYSNNSDLLVQPAKFGEQAAANLIFGGHLDDSDLRIQFSATRKFLLESEDSLGSRLGEGAGQVSTEKSGGTNIQANDNKIGSFTAPNYVADMQFASGNSPYNLEFPDIWFGHNQFDPSPRVNTSLTVAQKQYFSIREISPEWAFSHESTKVIITGDFFCDPSLCSWAVMFGGEEVPAEIIQHGVLRCQTPQNYPGKVTLCITSSNRESCSEVRDFEFRAKPVGDSCVHGESPFSNIGRSSSEILVLAKFVRMLLFATESLVTCKDDEASKLKTNDKYWQQMIDELSMGCEDTTGAVDRIMEELLKNKLQQWLIAKYQQDHSTNSLSKEEQSIIHLVAALGYVWALSPILSAGVGINFRDENGWTALHWAAYYGREKMVAVLLASGALATAVTDPTPQDPVGKQAAFIAAARGHKGLAGYLSEALLTEHLASLVIEETEISKGSAALEAQSAVEGISQRNAELHGTSLDELSYKDSFAGLRNAIQAAARIQSAFRAYSFRKRQQRSDPVADEYGLTQEDIGELSATSRLYFRHSGSSMQSYDKAATSIQKNFRGYKGRKNFLNIRSHVIKIQAHVRGHQVRKRHKDFLRIVSVLEKVILRWRRKGTGLRGFHVEQPVHMVDHDNNAEDDYEELLKVFRRQKVDTAVENALSRVVSMVDSPDARQQYRRMLEDYQEAAAERSTRDESEAGDSRGSILGDTFMY